MTTPTDLADLAESLVPTAQRLIGAVHDDGVAEVGRVLHVVPSHHLPALAVVLAAMCDPDRSAATALSWVSWADPEPSEQGNLFAGTLDVDVPESVRRAGPIPGDPKDWDDDRCKELHSAWRRRQRGRGDPEANPAEELAGYREYDRRRHSTSRRPGPSATVAQLRRGQSASTPVASEA